jgi:hypothetical protein
VRQKQTYFIAINRGYKVCQKKTYFIAINPGYKVCQKQVYFIATNLYLGTRQSRFAKCFCKQYVNFTICYIISQPRIF